VCLWCWWCVCGANLNVDGCIAQSVERWSNKPLVKGSSPFVTTFVFVFFAVVISSWLLWVALVLSSSVAFVAERLRRYVQVVVHFVGVGSSPTECNSSFFRHFPSDQPLFGYRWRWSSELETAPPIQASGNRVLKNTKTKENKTKRMAVPGFEPGSSGSQPLMLTTTLYHQRTRQHGSSSSIDLARSGVGPPPTGSTDGLHLPSPSWLVSMLCSELVSLL
jgi:hypothetical protein